MSGAQARDVDGNEVRTGCWLRNTRSGVTYQVVRFIDEGDGETRFADHTGKRGWGIEKFWRIVPAPGAPVDDGRETSCGKPGTAGCNCDECREFDAEHAPVAAPALSYPDRAAYAIPASPPEPDYSPVAAFAVRSVPAIDPRARPEWPYRTRAGRR